MIVFSCFFSEPGDNDCEGILLQEDKNIIGGAWLCPNVTSKVFFVLICFCIFFGVVNVVILILLIYLLLFISGWVGSWNYRSEWK